MASAGRQPVEVQAKMARGEQYLVPRRLQHAGPLELVDQHALLGSVIRREDQLGLARALHGKFSVLIHVAVRVASDDDRLLPADDAGLDVGDEDRFAERGAVERRPGGTPAPSRVETADPPYVTTVNPMASSERVMACSAVSSPAFL